MNLHTYDIITFLFIVFVMFFSYKVIKSIPEQQECKDRRYTYWLQIVIFAGVLTRVLFLNYPYGVNYDEAINGYDTWCLAHYGVDQHLSSYPVYFKSWSSGQSALYAYFALPFIKLFGLSTPVHRLPMALISCLSILLLYRTLIRVKANTLFTFILVSLCIISPWHIMKSRWALDCNISPDLMLIAVCFITYGIYSQAKKRLIYYILGFIFLALTAYGYGVSWIILPAFCIALFYYLLKKKYITVKELAISTGIMGILLIPLILFAFNNMVFEGETYSIGPLTITLLDKGRHASTTIFGSENLAYDIKASIKKAVFLVFWGTDSHPWNSLRLWGQFYNLLGLPFVIYSFYRYKKYKQTDILDTLFLIWIISCIPVTLFVEPNVNHWNLLWFPLIYFCAKGIYLFITKFQKKVISIGICILFILSFSCFLYEYATFYHPKKENIAWLVSPGFEQHVEDPIKFVQEIDVDKVYFSRIFPTGAFPILFYHPINPYLLNKAESDEETKPGRYYAQSVISIDSISPKPKTAYIISNGEVDKVNLKDFNVKKFSRFSVLF